MWTSQVSRTDKEFWTQQKLENEKELLKRKAHKKQVSVYSSGAALNGKQGGSSSSETHGPGGMKFTRSKHNAKQCKLYQKRQKAKKAEARKAEAGTSQTSAMSATATLGQ